MSSKNKLALLPPKKNLETVDILKQLNRANRALAELKGYAEIIPNKNILINSIALNEAKDSSEIENIITTHDELYAALAETPHVKYAAKEVVNYRKAIWKGYELINQKEFLSINIIVEIQKEILENNAGIRKLPGTSLINERTGEVVYTPPESEEEILELLSNLEEYINADNDNIDPLIKLSVIHYQFEATHPFYNGNGRTGRIINVLYLILKGLLDTPILYLSKYIIENKTAYYNLLKGVTEKGDWESWIMYMLQAIEQTAVETLILARKIKELFDETVEVVNEKLPKIYSRELIEIIFSEVYTKASIVEKKMGIHRSTAIRHLKELESIGILQVQGAKPGIEIYYLNKKLYELLKSDN